MATEGCSSQRKGFRSLPRALRWYLWGVTVGALLAAALLAPALPEQQRDLPLALLFLALLLLAQHFEIHLAPRIKVSTDTAVLFALVLIFHPAVILPLVAVGTFVGNVAARRRWYNASFNAAQVGLSTALAGLVYQSLGTGRLDQVANLPAQLPAIALAAGVMYGSNVLLLEMAVALQSGRRPLVGWWHRHQRDLPHQVALFLLGTLPGLTARNHPWTLALLAVPISIVYLSLRDTIRLREQTREAVEALADMVDLRDPYTHGHSQRVAEYAGLIARRLGLPPEETEVVRAAARVHDIGKIAVPDRVLLKPGRLDQAEYREIQRHQEVGAQLLERFPDFREGRSYVLAHHERPDGRGYGRGLKMSAIPLGAAIIAVADSFDAMISDRPYRRALSLEAAIEELRRYRGRQWEGRVVDAFLALLEEGVPSPTQRQMSVARA